MDVGAGGSRDAAWISLWSKDYRESSSLFGMGRGIDTLRASVEVRAIGARSHTCSSYRDLKLIHRAKVLRRGRPTPLRSPGRRQSYPPLPAGWVLTCCSFSIRTSFLKDLPMSFFHGCVRWFLYVYFVRDKGQKPLRITSLISNFIFPMGDGKQQ